MKTICLIQCHTSSKIKEETLKHNIIEFGKISDYIIVNNSIEHRNTSLESQLTELAKVPIQFNYFQNTNTICAGKLLCCLNENIDKVLQFERTIVTNDSFIVVNSLTPFKEFFESKNREMYGLLSSRQTSYHYPDFLRAYNSDGVKKLHKYLTANIHKCKETAQVIEITEIKSTYCCENIDCFYETDLQYKDNLHFDDEKMEQYLKNKSYPIVKLKYFIGRAEYPKSMNYLPDDFNPHEYRTLHSDLSHLDDIDISRHFLKNGIKEGRKYKAKQKTVSKKYLQDMIPTKIVEVCGDVHYQ
jgi:hypothetical protein